MSKTYNIKPKQRHIAIALKRAENRRKPIGAILKEEGYKDSICKSPTKVTETIGYKLAELQVLEEMKSLERDTIDRMKKTVKKAPYMSVAMNRKHLRDQIWEAQDRAKNNNEAITKIQIEFK